MVGYNRPGALTRLLESLTRAHYPAEMQVPLVISLDRSPPGACRAIAAVTDWPHGPKRVIAHQQRLGLRKHVLSCGDLAADYGSVIVFEDDLVVSAYFYQYALAARDHYQRQDRIAGIGLYGYDIIEQCRRRFIPLDDGYDSYFTQMAVSWGQLWTDRQWQEFRRWYDQHAGQGVTQQPGIPAAVCAWPESSWKKYFVRYLVETGRFFVHPRRSLTTNFGDTGTHDKGGGWNQVPLLLAPCQYRFAKLEESLAVYDAFFEPLPDRLQRLNPDLAEYDFCCDLYGTRTLALVDKPYLLSCRRCREPVASFGLEMLPEAANPAFGIRGDFFQLGRSADFAPQSFKKDLVATAFMHKVSRPQTLVGGTVGHLYNGLRQGLSQLRRRLGGRPGRH